MSRRAPLLFAAPVALALVLVLALVLQGRRFSNLRANPQALPGRAPAPAPRDTGSPAVPAWFTEEAEARGIRFPVAYDGPRPLNIRQTAGSGAALWDYDGDGWLDIYLVGQRQNRPTGGALYRNRGDGTFEDRTAGSGLAVPGDWHGCAVGDVDNDGRPDLLLAGYGTVGLFRNRGDGRFARAAAGRGLDPPAPNAWATSAAFADVDRDGLLDVFIGRYVRFGPAELQFCDYHGVRAACGPKTYDPQYGSLYLNQGEGRFREVTRTWGLGDQHGKTFGVAFADANADGFPDLYLANDEVPGDLYLNEGGRRFRNHGGTSGTAVGQDGQVQGGMGVDWGDFDRDGLLDLFVTTFQNEDHSLYRNLDGENFEHATSAVGLGNITRPYVAFGARFLDFDNDGWLDLIAASGHIQDNVAEVDRTATYRQPLQLLRNQQGSRFQDVSGAAGEVFRRRLVGRGLAVGDIDNDGDQDLLITDLEGPPMLLINQVARGRRWLSISLEGSRSNRHALGARVEVRAGGAKHVRERWTGNSFLSASDPRVHFGLGTVDRVDLEVRWPSGRRTRVRDAATDRILTLREQP